MSQLTTHALDLVRGCGAGGLEVSATRLSPDRHDFGAITLGADGRGVLISGEAFRPGVYELVFLIGAYHRSRSLADDSAFLEEAPVRFRVADASAHCHLPILISLYGYSVYRGG